MPAPTKEEADRAAQVLVRFLMSRESAGTLRIVATAAAAGGFVARGSIYITLDPEVDRQFGELLRIKQAMRPERVG